jgi:chitodextrinase
MITTWGHSLCQAIHWSTVQPQVQAMAAAGGVSVLSYHWDFGNGTVASGAQVSHTFTRVADYNVNLTVDGLDGPLAEKGTTVALHGALKQLSTCLETGLMLCPAASSAGR